MKRGDIDLHLFNLNEKGMSAIIVTLLLVMLSIVLTGVVFVAVHNIIKTGTQQVSSSSQCLNSGAEVTSFSCLQDGTQCNVTVRRTSGSDSIGGVRLIFTNDKGESNVSDSPGNIVTLATKSITATNIGVINITQVGVAIYFLDSAEKPIPCSTKSNALIGSINSGGTTGTVGGSEGSGTPSPSTCTPASDPTFAGLCGSYQCGDVNNGTCSLVSCGTCLSDEYCNLTTHTCETSPANCTPASDPTFAGLCTNNNYTCGDVNNGSCATVSCGTCLSDEYCNLDTHTCESNSNCVPASDTYCADNNYECGVFNNGTCSGTINCATGTGPDGCNFPDFCNSTYQCEAPKMLNNGTIYSSWPTGAARFFDSNDLPKSQSEDDALAAGAQYNNENSFVRFPGSAETSCIQISYIIYQNSTNMSFVALSLPTGDYANISAGDKYKIWNTQSGCLNDTST